MSDFAIELRTLVRANHPIVWVVTHEEDRFDSILKGPNGVAKDRSIYEWSNSKGLRTVQTVKNENMATKELSTAQTEVSHDVDAALQIFEGIASGTVKRTEGMHFQLAPRAIGIFRDLHRFVGKDSTYRLLRDLASTLKGTYAQVIVTSPITNFPPELEKEITVLHMPLPTLEDLRAAYTLKVGEKDDGNGGTDEILRAGLGLTEQEFILACTESLARDRVVLPATIVRFKEQAVKKSQVLELEQPTLGMSDVGGLDRLKAWVDERSVGFTQKGQNFGVRAPKAILLTGPPGTGKTMIARAVATRLNVPLLVLRSSGIMSKYVGESEQKMRQVFTTTDSMGACIVFIDEVEKFLAGSQAGSGDSGVTRKVFGELLSWMNDHTTPVLVIATCNDPTALQPEFVGRFDETFFVDLPNLNERREIFGIHIQRMFHRVPTGFDLTALAVNSERFCGREIEQVLNSAGYKALHEGHELTTDDILSVVRETKPLAVKRAIQIEEMRGWANDNAIRASTPLVESTTVGPANGMIGVVRGQLGA